MRSRCDAFEPQILSCFACDTGDSTNLVAVGVRSCCCALNECFDYSTVVTAQSQCIDGCANAVVTGSTTDNRQACLAQGTRFETQNREGLADFSGAEGQICSFLGYIAPVEPSCDCTNPSLCGGANQPCNVDVSSRTARLTCQDNPGCEWTPRVREQLESCRARDEAQDCDEFRFRNDTCSSQGTCVFIPEEYNARPELDTDMTTANAFCG